MAARGLATVICGDLNFEFNDSDVLQGMPQVSWPSLARLVAVCSSAHREVAICPARPLPQQIGLHLPCCGEVEEALRDM